MDRCKTLPNERVVLGSVMLLWILSACVAGPQNRIALPETQKSPTPFTEITPTESSQPRPTVRNELHATNPETVSLASGKVQLVEFFAYW